MNLRGGTQFSPTTPLLISRPLTVLHLRHPLPSISCPSPQTHLLFLYGFISFALLEVHSTEVECAGSQGRSSVVLPQTCFVWLGDRPSCGHFTPLPCPRTDPFGSSSGGSGPHGHFRGQLPNQSLWVPSFTKNPACTLGSFGGCQLTTQRSQRRGQG